MGGLKDTALAHVVAALIGLKDWTQLALDARELVEAGGKNAEFGREAIALVALNQDRQAEAETYLQGEGPRKRWPVRLMRGFLEAGSSGPVLDYLSQRLASRRGKNCEFIRDALRCIRQGKPVDWFMLANG
jgi:hypothetical protein